MTSAKPAGEAGIRVFLGERRRPLVYPLAAAAVFALLTALWIGRVGVEPKNCQVALDAAAFLHGRFMPLAFNYKGGPGVYLLLAPFVLAFGTTLRALRVSSVIWSAACVAGAGVLAERASGRGRAGLAAAALTAATPALTSLVPLGQFGGAAETALAAFGLAELLACEREPTPRRARTAGFLLGLALATKAVIGGLVVGLLVHAFLHRRRLGPGGKRLIAEGAACFALPLLPYLWALAFGGQWRRWLDQRPLGELAGPAPIAYAAGLEVRLTQLVRTLTSAGAHPALTLSAGAFAAALIAASLWSLGRAPGPSRSGPSALWTMFACFIAVSPISPSSLRSLHLLTVIPVFWAAVAASASLAAPGFARRLCAGLAAAYVGAASCVAGSFAASAARDGGEGTNYDAAIIDMARYFAARPELSPVICGPDTDELMLLFLTGRAPTRLELDDSPAFDAAWRRALDDRSSVFVVAANDSTDAVRARAGGLGRPLAEIGVLVDRLGVPAHRLLARER